MRGFCREGVPHAFAYVGNPGTSGKNLVLFQPAGQMEEFFQVMARDVHAATDPKTMAQFGIQFVGPPLAI